MELDNEVRDNRELDELNIKVIMKREKVKKGLGNVVISFF